MTRALPVDIRDIALAEVPVYVQPAADPGAADVAPAVAPTVDQIAAEAFARFEARGGEHGHDLEDWLAAEASLRAEAMAARLPGN